MNLNRRLDKIENIHKAEELSIDIVTIEESEDPQEKLREKEKELNRKIDIPIYIKIISNN